MHRLIPAVLSIAFALPHATARSQRSTPANRTGLSQAISRPNIVLITADDLGYADVGVQGAKDIPTPNIDRIAREGARFTNAYAASPLCSPSRAGLLTGRYPQRWGHEFNPGPTKSDSAFGLPSTEPTLAERLKAVGYTTGLVGKWHLGYRAQTTPTYRGFDEFYGFLGATHRYRSDGDQRMGPMVRGTKLVSESLDITDAFAREAVSFVKANATKPFFLYLAFNAVHVPLMPDAPRLGRMSSIKDPERRRYAATVVAMDEAIGAVLSVLDKERLTGRTIVLFASDNGGAALSTKSSNGALSGVKGQLLEGGVRVPFLVRWPGTVKPGTAVQATVSALDVAPTVTALAGVPAVGPSFDGVDLAPVVRGSSAGSPERTLYWRVGTTWAIRKGSWKLIKFNDGSPRLYDLSTDVAERHDLAAKRRDVVAALRKEWERWSSRMQPPKWGKEGWMGVLTPET
ncbi:MAG: Arylsulfatase [Gemmatimonadaceae bacterium]|nr:Arylsulfatase [Gemmatimonadaceae bacterium]